MTLDEILTIVRFEVEGAENHFDPFNSAHEGYAVILEEMDELWQEIKHGKPGLSREMEAVQVAAMAVRFLLDLQLDTPKMSTQKLADYQAVQWLRAELQAGKR